jgi:hypothetical protein
VYTGKDTQIQSPLVTQEMNKTTAIALQLIEQLLDKVHTVWLHNFYNSPLAYNVTLGCVWRTVCFQAYHTEFQF